MTSRTRTALYFGTLGLFSLAMIGSAAMDLTQPAQLVEGAHRLGIPMYVMSLLGVWKLLGVAAILVPDFPRLKEWAYAGFVFDLSGAAVSHQVSGDGLGTALVPVLLLSLGLVSWALRPESRRL